MGGRTKLPQILLLLQPEQLARLQALVQSSGRKRMELLREAVDDLLSKHAAGGKPPPARKPTWERPAAEEHIYAKAGPKPQAKPTPAPKPKAPRKPRPKLTPEQRQADLAKRFAEASTAKTYLFAGRADMPRATCCGVYLTSTGRVEVRMVNPFSYIARWISDGVSTYRRHDNYRAYALFVKPAQTEAGMQATRRRARELHPDKLGRDQTPDEREEYTGLMASLEAARAEQVRQQRDQRQHARKKK